MPVCARFFRNDHFYSKEFFIVLYFYTIYIKYKVLETFTLTLFYFLNPDSVNFTVRKKQTNPSIGMLKKKNFQKNTFFLISDFFFGITVLLHNVQ